MKLSKPIVYSDGSVLSNWLALSVVGLALAGLGVAAMTSVVAKSRVLTARILTAQEQIRGLESGVLDFLDDRGDDSETFSEHISPIGNEMTQALTQQNPAGKHYWDTGKHSASASDSAPTDPFGGAYWIVVDADRDGRLRNPAVADGEQWLEGRVLIFSAGPDGDPTTWKDNVRNWK